MVVGFAWASTALISFGKFKSHLNAFEGFEEANVNPLKG